VSHKYKTFEGKIYYVTLTVVGWIDVFSRKEHVYEIFENLKYCQEKKGLQLYAYVVMTNHIHLICSRECGTVNELLRDFKSYTSKRLVKMIDFSMEESRQEWLMHMFRFFGRGNSANEEFQFWQNGNHGIELNNPEILQQKIKYLHMNPVKAGFVEEPHHWIYSSAYPFSYLKVLEM
jgi:putative transposase